LGIETDEKKAKDFFNVLDAGKDIMFGVAAMAVGTSIGITAMLDKALLAAIALSQFNAATGLSTQTLQAWQHVGEAMGGTADEVTGSVMSLNKALKMAQLTGAGMAPFSMLGISVNSDAWTVLKQLRDIIRTTTDPGALTKVVALMGQMGVTAPSLIKSLKLTNEEWTRFANLGNIITDAQIKPMLDFNAAMKELGQTITYLFGMAFAELAPGMTDIINKTKEWVEVNKTDLKGAIKDVVGVVGEFWDLIKGAGEEVNRIVNATAGWKNALEMLAAAFIVVKLANAEWYAILLLVAAVLHDINALLTGEGWEKTWLGKFLKFGFELGTKMENVPLLNGQLLPSFGAGFGGKTNNLVLNQNIYGTGDPRETGRFAAEGVGGLFDIASGDIRSYFATGEAQ
jgi:hypothetical protein